MLWFALALLGACCQAAYGLIAKVVLRSMHPYPVAGFSFLTGAVVLLTLSALSGIPPLGPGFLPAVAVTVGINLIATILFYRALASTDLSLCAPMLAFTPVFLIVTSFLILGELPSPGGAVGILLVTAGAYLLNLEYGAGSRVSFTAPLVSLVTNRGILAMLFVAFLYSISVNYDKQVVLASDPVFGSAVVFLLLGVAFLTLTTGRWVVVPPENRGRGSPFLLRYPWAIPFAALGFLLAGEAIAINTAYTLAVVPYVIAVKRLAVVISVLFGVLLLAEREAAGRMIGAGVMIIGAVMIGVVG